MKNTIPEKPEKPLYLHYFGRERERERNRERETERERERERG